MCADALVPKAQKPWARRYHAAVAARKHYHRACKALLAAEEQAEQADSGPTGSFSFVSPGMAAPTASRPGARPSRLQQHTILSAAFFPPGDD